MSARDVFEAVRSTGLPCARTCWPEGQAPPLPWAVYLLDGDAPVMADDSRYAECSRWRVELYERSRDPDLESALLAALADRFGPCSLGESWVESEGCHLVSATFTDRYEERDGYA